jgi:WD40 repeat protein
MQAIRKLRIPVVPSRIITKVRYWNFGDQAYRSYEADRTPPMRLILTSLISCAILIGSALCLAPADAQLRGHGGPIRALAISADGATALSGSFDTSAIRWSLRRNTAEQVLRFHEGAVNAVAILADGRAVTAGEDARIAVWTPGGRSPTLFSKDTRGRSLHSRYRLTVPRSPRHPGIVRSVCGRSQVARHRCSMAISRMSTGLASRRMVRRW